MKKFKKLKHSPLEDLDTLFEQIEMRSSDSTSKTNPDNPETIDDLALVLAHLLPRPAFLQPARIDIEYYEPILEKAAKELALQWPHLGDF